ncbi:MAG: heme-binding domain-containing protein [Caldilineaceae bacterium]|nr:heme-binding domain-containing protein [Caldilineaceae bacterium]
MMTEVEKAVDGAEQQVNAQDVDGASTTEEYTERGIPDVPRRHRRLLIGFIVAVVGGLIFMQFLPLGISRDNPPVTAEITWDTPNTEALARRACYDCHSNETEWPWYSYVAPISWMVVQDIVKGREVLNFSEWTPEHAAAAETEEAVELVSKGLMPLPYYEILHPEATLNERETGELIYGLIATLSEPGEALDTENIPDAEE